VQLKHGDLILTVQNVNALFAASLDNPFKQTKKQNKNLPQRFTPKTLIFFRRQDFTRAKTL
jgi:hypothetical protein